MLLVLDIRQSQCAEMTSKVFEKNRDRITSLLGGFKREGF
jgi:hypothetical protein